MPSDRVSETAPVQVYLDRQSRDRLGRLATSTSSSMSEVLRRGLLALERELTDPTSHPALRMVGVATEGESLAGYDVAREHDRFLAAVHEAKPPSGSGARKKRSRRG